jgi:hypothetical protein
MLGKYMSSTGLERYMLRYKIIYSTVALILGLIAVIGGYWLFSLDGYYTEATGWMLNIFGCAILYNNNNMAPGFFLFLVGLFLIIITQYKTRTNRKPKGQSNIDEQALLYKFIYSMMGLTVGFLCTIFGIVLAENGGNLCPTDWATKITSYETLYFTGAMFFLTGIIISIVTRYRIRIYYGLGEDNTKELNN